MLGRFQHGITFHNYCFEVHVSTTEGVPDGLQWIAVTELSKLPISTVIRKAARVVSRVGGEGGGSGVKVAKIRSLRQLPTVASRTNETSKPAAPVQ